MCWGHLSLWLSYDLRELLLQICRQGRLIGFSPDGISVCALCFQLQHQVQVSSECPAHDVMHEGCGFYSGRVRS